MVQVTRRQHYVPVFYLRRFSKDEKIWVFDKQESKKFETSIDNVAVENYFYCDETQQEIEQLLAHIEGFVATIITKIVNDRTISNLTAIEHKWLSFWIFLQDLRTRRFRSEHRDAFIKVLNRLKDFDTSSITEGLLRRSQIDMMFGKGRLELVNAIDSMHWCLLTNRSTIDYYTSDSPIIKENTHYRQQIDKDNIFVCVKCNYSFLKDGNCPECGDPLVHVHPSRIALFREGKDANLGFFCPGLEIRFPLDPKFCLVLINPLFKEIEWNQMERLSIGKGRCADSPDIEWNNSHIVAMSHRFIFSCSDDFSLAESFLIEHPEYRKPYSYSIVG
jgi:hypothetical protein